MITKRDALGNITYRAEAAPGKYILNCEPSAPICRVPNFRFRQTQYRYGIYDSVIQRELGWTNDKYYAALNAEQPSDVEQVMVNAVLEAAKRCPGNSLFKKANS